MRVSISKTSSSSDVMRDMPASLRCLPMLGGGTGPIHRRPARSLSPVGTFAKTIAG